MRVIPKRASVCGLHADVVAAHPFPYRGMHFASCSCEQEKASPEQWSRVQQSPREESRWNNASRALGSPWFLFASTYLATDAKCMREMYIFYLNIFANVLLLFNRTLRQRGKFLYILRINNKFSVLLQINLNYVGDPLSLRAIRD